MTTDLLLKSQTRWIEVEGGVVLLFGKDGVGCSTLIAQAISGAPFDRALYVINDEPVAWMEARVRRIRAGTPDGESARPQIEIVMESDVDRVIERARAMRAQVLVVDTIHLMSTSHFQAKAGHARQILACVDRLIDFAKTTGTRTFLLGYTRKDGDPAGPWDLQTRVDCVLVLKPHRSNPALRVLQCPKSRFGLMRDEILERSAAGRFIAMGADLPRTDLSSTDL